MRALPLPLPRLPSLAGLRTLRQIRRDRLALLRQLSDCDAPLVPFQAGPVRLVLVNTPAFARDVLVTQAAAFEKGSNFREVSRPVLGNGLVTSLNSFHRRQRRLVAPAFRHARVAAYADVMATYAEEAQRGWRDGQRLDVAHAMTQLTLRIVGRTLFDADLLAEANDVGRAITQVQERFNAVNGRLVRIPETWPTPGNRRARRAAARLDATIYRTIAERRGSDTDRGDLLSMLLSAQDADDGSFMTDQQVRDEAMTLFLAGHETTANGLAWAWYLLAQHPEAYDRLRAEAQHTLGGRPPTYADLARLPYALRVFKEAMRLYPPVPVVARQASREVTVNGQTFPEGTRFLVSQYAMHRRPEYFPDPDRFDPDRFTPEAEARLPRDAYLPFADGPRNCIGASFALMEGQIVLATLAQRVAFALVPGQRVVPQPLVTLRPKHGIAVTVRRLPAAPGC